MGDYQPLRSEDIHANVNAPARSKPTVYYLKPMSPLRKFAFGCSVLLCFLTTVVFLWVIPCDWSKCPAKSQHQPIMSWDRSIEGLEIIGPMKVVRGAQGLNIVAMYQGALQGSGTANDHFPPKSGGLISFIGASGLIAWFIRLPVLATHLDCFSLRIGDDSLQDCLVRGVNGYLTLVNSLSGVAKWRAQSPVAGQSLVDISFPVVTPDVDGDGYRDLAVTGSLEKSHRVIAIVSGQTGSIMGKPLEVKGCTDINNLTLDRDTLYYTCRNITSKLFSERQLPLREAVYNMTGRSVVPRDPVAVATHHQSNEWTVNNYRLNLVNSGHSPSDYQVSATVTDHNNQSVWSAMLQQTYAMTPVVLHFQKAISGFLLKFWYWHAPYEQKKDKDGNVVNSISERVLLVTFNATGSPPHVVNASQTDIVQLCFNKTCQPELAYQTESLLIVDLDEDGSQELISYLVTFQPKGKPAAWKLQSKVRLIRLEAELPKLYETTERH